MILKKSSRWLGVTYGFPTAIIMNEHQNLTKIIFLSEKMVTQILLTRTQTTINYVCFVKCTQIKNKLKPPKDSSHKCVNNYSPFSPSSSLILSSLSVESSSRISFRLVFSQILWRQLYSSSKGYHSSCIFERLHCAGACLTCIHTQSVVARELCRLLLQSR